MKIHRTLAAAALATTIAVGGSASAFAAGTGDTGNGNGLSADKIAEICERQDEIIPHLTERQTELTQRISDLTTAQIKATDAGKTKLADRLAKRIATLQIRLDRVENRLAKAPAWIEEHCA